MTTFLIYVVSGRSLLPRRRGAAGGAVRGRALRIVANKPDAIAQNKGDRGGWGKGDVGGGNDNMRNTRICRAGFGSFRDPSSEPPNGGK